MLQRFKPFAQKRLCLANQAGKGRDVGLNQIAMFEAKVASGNGEQVLSRDVYRLGHRLDFFRMLSFYYTTVGFFINNLIVVLTVFAFLWGRVYLAVSGVEASLTNTKVLSNTALLASLNQQLIVQLGILTALPMIVENALEHGFTKALWEFFTMQLQLASVFFTFSMGTRAHYFGRTLLHGGAAVSLLCPCFSFLLSCLKFSSLPFVDRLSGEESVFYYLNPSLYYQHSFYHCQN
jgi:callose synthase